MPARAEPAPEVQFVDALEGLLQESEAAEARRKLAALLRSQA